MDVCVCASAHVSLCDSFSKLRLAAWCRKCVMVRLFSVRFVLVLMLMAYAS